MLGYGVGGGRGGGEGGEGKGGGAKGISPPPPGYKPPHLRTCIVLDGLNCSIVW